MDFLFQELLSTGLFSAKMWDSIFEKKISKNFFNGFRGVTLVVFSAQVLTNLRMEIV